jgi:uncharacterized membrane protein
MNQSTIRGAMIASAVAGLFACGGSAPQAAAPSGTTTSAVKCFGINSCKGLGECATATHPCGKHTPGPGQGWLTVPSADECAARGGKVL